MTTFRVLIDWDADGDFTTTGAPISDDISAYVKRVELNIGSQHAAYGVADVGTCVLTVDNQQRYFSPAWTDGPLYGKLLPRRAVKVEVIDEFGVHPRFVGVIERIQPDSGTYLRRECMIHCIDWLGILADHQLSLPLLTNQRGDQLVRQVLNAAFEATPASAILRFNGQPNAGHTVTVQDVTYTFRTALGAAINEVLIGPSVYHTLDNLQAAINGYAGVGAQYSIGTRQPMLVRAVATPSAYQVIGGAQPLRYYRLGESVGQTTATDFGTNRSPVTYQGGCTRGTAGALAGDADTCCTLDGISGTLLMPALDLRGCAFTIALWLRPESSPPATQDIINWQATAGGSTPQQGLYWRLSANGMLQFGFNADQVVTAAGVVQFGAWQHLAATYNNLTGVGCLYVNGVLVGQATLGTLNALTKFCYIGSHNAASNFVKGRLDEVAIFARALSSTDLQSHISAAAVSFGLRLDALLGGQVGNAFALTSTSPLLVASSTTLLGGTDLPVSGVALQTGQQVFPTAGDGWQAEQTTALQAIREVTISEYGRFYQTAAGMLQWRNRNHPFQQAAQPPALTMTGADPSEPLPVGDASIQRLYNHVTVQLTPRGTLAAGVIVRAENPFVVPGLSARTLVFKYIDPGTGQPMAASALVLPPEPVTDWQAGERTAGDNNGVYNNFNWLRFECLHQGTSVRVTIRNLATGPLTIFNFQLRGTGLVCYQRTNIVAEDSTSQHTYHQRSYTLHLPLAADPTFAMTLANYLLSRYQTPRHEIMELRCGARQSLQGVSLHTLDLGHVLDITDPQTGVQAERYEVIGLRARLTSGGADDELTYLLHSLDQTTYGLYSHTTLGCFDQTHYAL